MSGPTPESRPAATVPFDARALQGPVDRNAVREFVRQLKAQGRYPSRGAGSAVSIAMFAVVGVIFLVVGSSVVGSFVRAGVASGGGFGALFAIVPLLIFVGVIAVLVWRIVGLSSAARWFRLDRFATANGMTFTPAVADPPLPGMIFGRGTARQVDYPRLAFSLGRLVLSGRVDRIFLDTEFIAPTAEAARRLVHPPAFPAWVADRMQPPGGVLRHVAWHTDHVHVRFLGPPGSGVSGM